MTPNEVHRAMITLPQPLLIRTLGAALAVAFHNAGFHVYATARNLSKMKQLTPIGISTLSLDVQSESSIATCVAQIPSLDILVNNAGAIYTMPFSDLSIPQARILFDLNVWSYLVVTQAFLPLLLKSKGIIVNQTSGASILPVPFQSAYNASKAAIAMFSNTQRLELAPFGVKVVDLKTGATRTNISKNSKGHSAPVLPTDSIYGLAREVVEHTMSGEVFFKTAGLPEPWAEGVVRDLLRGNPPSNVWRGDGSWFVKLTTSVMPTWVTDMVLKNLTGLDIVTSIIKEGGR